MADPVDIVRLAGFLDSEGCIRIHTWKRSKEVTVFSLRIYIGNCDKRLSCWLFRKFGGKVYEFHKKNVRHRTCYSWEITSSSAADLLKKVRPFLISKIDEADIAIKFCRTISTCWSVGRSLARTRRWSMVKEIERAKKFRPPPNRMASTVFPTVLDFAQMAALIDGEGSILLSRPKRGKASLLRVFVTNTDGRLIDWCLRRFDGGVLVWKSKIKNRATQYKWNTSSRKAEELLRKCLPYFVLKGRQARLALRYRSTVGRSWEKIGKAKRLLRMRIRSQMFSERGRNVCPLTQ